MIEAQAALASHRLAHRNAGLIYETLQRVCGLRVDDAATGDNQGMLAVAYPHCRLLQRVPVWPITLNVPGTPGEEGFWIGICLRLYVLREGQRDSAGFRGTGQYAHNLWERGQHLLRTRDAVPVAAHGLEAIVDRDILCVLGLKLL